MRVIDADALIDRLDERKRKEPGIRNIADILRVQSFIDSQPTACDVSCGYNKEDIEINRKAAYNKAIDDFVQKVKEHQYVLSDVINSKDYGMFTVGIEQIAEQLKAGEQNKQSKQNT